MAQLVARLNGIQKVRGSNPLSSTSKISLLRNFTCGSVGIRLAAGCDDLYSLGNTHGYAVVGKREPAGEGSRSACRHETNGFTHRKRVGL